ncbi:MAG: hypothetical protein AAF560_11780 [Acidobacteriota bacterium]
MPFLLLPAVLLIILPALLLARRLGWLERRWQQGLAAGAGLMLVIDSWPQRGLELAILKQLYLLIAAAAALLLLLRHYRIRWTLDPRRFDRALAGLAILGVVAYCNFFAFHGVTDDGERTFVHLHDVAHYYLGAKYYPELGYTELYTAMLRAEAELHDDHFKAIEARDLADYRRVHIRELLQRSDPVKAAFSPERWADFQRDVDVFRERLGPHYGTVLLDHGFNPTPVWALAGGWLSNWVPAGSERGILLLTLLDPLILIAMFGIVGRTFGRRTALLTVIHFCVAFGATFGWVGGAFLRFPWLFGLVVGLCCLHRKRYELAGGLLAVATMTRVFPGFFLVPLAAKAVTVAWRRRELPRRYVALFGGCLVTAVILALATLALPRGASHWGEFHANMSNHLRNISPNVVGLTELLTLRLDAEQTQVTGEEFEALKARRQQLRNAQLWIVFVPLLALSAYLAPRRTDLGIAHLALPLLYAGLSLAGYYYAVLMVAILVERSSPKRLSWIFAVEALAYVLMLFETRDALVYVYRGALVAWLYVGLNLQATHRVGGHCR